MDDVESQAEASNGPIKQCILYVHNLLLLLLLLYVSTIYKFPGGEKVFLEKLIDRKQIHEPEKEN